MLEPLIDEGKEVVLIGHSSGGISMSAVAEGRDLASRTKAGKQGGIVRLIFLAAFVLPSGQSLLGMLGGQPLPWMIVEVSIVSPSSSFVPQMTDEFVTHQKGDRVSGNPDMLPQVGFNDLPPAEQEKWAKEMTHTSAALFATPAAYEPWAHGVPCSYIFTELDGGIPFPAQQGMAQLLGPGAKSATLKSGHCPFLSMPGDLIKAIESVL